MKYIFIVAFFFTLPLAAVAQRPGNDRMENIEAHKIAFLTQKLDLNPEQAKVLWPVYNAWQKEQAELRKEKYQKMISFRKVTEIDELSETEIEALILNDFNFKQREMNLDRKYYYRLKAILPIKIIGKLYRAEEAFKRELLNKYRTVRPQQKE